MEAKTKSRLTSYNFWVKLASAVILILRIILSKFGIEIDSAFILDIATLIAGFLVVLGIINEPTGITISYKNEDIKGDENMNEEKDFKTQIEEKLNEVKDIFTSFGVTDECVINAKLTQIDNFLVSLFDSELKSLKVLSDMLEAPAKGEKTDKKEERKPLANEELLEGEEHLRNEGILAGEEVLDGEEIIVGHEVSKNKIALKNEEVLKGEEVLMNDDTSKNKKPLVNENTSVSEKVLSNEETAESGEVLREEKTLKSENVLLGEDVPENKKVLGDGESLVQDEISVGEKCLNTEVLSNNEEVAEGEECLSLGDFTESKKIVEVEKLLEGGETSKTIFEKSEGDEFEINNQIAENDAKNIQNDAKNTKTNTTITQSDTKLTKPANIIESGETSPEYNVQTIENSTQNVKSDIEFYENMSVVWVDVKSSENNTKNTESNTQSPENDVIAGEKVKNDFENDNIIEVVEDMNKRGENESEDDNLGDEEVLRNLAMSGITADFVSEN